MKKTTLLFYLLFLSFTTFAQSDFFACITSDGSTSGNARAPHGRFRYQRGVVLITAAEMTASGIVSGNVINSIAFNYLVAQNVTTTGTMTLYLENTADATNLKPATWSTAGMTTVSTGAVTIPNTVGNVFFNFTGGTTFTYTGGAVYMAFDYQNASNPLPTTFVSVDCNSTGLLGGFKGNQSDTAVPTTIGTSNFRPVILLGKSVACARPFNIQEDVASKTTTSVTGTWNNVNNTDIEYGVSGYTPGTGTLISNVTSPYTITGLLPSTVYDVYFRNNCGTTGSPIYSDITEVETFHTVFQPITPPYNTSFEQVSFPYLGWLQPAGTPVGSDWQIQNFGPGALVQDGNISVYSLSGVTTASADNWILSRGVNLNAGNTATITFYTRNYQDNGSTGSATYNFTVGSAQNVASQTTTIATQAPFTLQTWEQKTYIFVPPTTGVYYFGIQNTSPPNTTGRQGLFIDNFTVTEPALANTDFVGSKFSISPNPTKDFINILNSENIKVSNITITDLNGRIVKQNNYNNVSNINLNVSDLSSGLYLLNISSNEGSVVKKIIKN